MELLWAVALQRHAYKPDGTKNMVGMGMSDEEVADVAAVDPRKPQLSQYAISSTGVHQQTSPVGALEHKASIETAGNERAARPQHGNSWFTHSLSPVISHDE